MAITTTTRDFQLQLQCPRLKLQTRALQRQSYFCSSKTRGVLLLLFVLFCFCSHEISCLTFAMLCNLASSFADLQERNDLELQQSSLLVDSGKYLSLQRWGWGGGGGGGQYCWLQIYL